MSYIFLECPSSLSEAAYEHIQESFRSFREKDPDFPKVVLLVDGLRIVAVTSDFDLHRVQLDPDEEAAVDRILEAAAARAKARG